MEKLLDEVRALAESETAAEKKSIHSELALMALALGFDVADDAQAEQFFQLVKLAATTQRPQVRSVFRRLAGSKSKERAAFTQIRKGLAGAAGG